MRQRFLLIFFLIAMPPLNVHSENWPQWRGPEQNGTSREKNLPLRWSATEGVAWRLELPSRSGSTPIVWGERIFLHVAEGDKLFLWAVDRCIVASPVIADGIIYAPTRVRPLLTFKPGGRGDVSKSHLLWSSANGPDVPTPVTDGKYFYIVNDRGIVWCLDAKTGEEIYGQQRLKPGTYSASPVLADGKIYVTNEDGLTSVVKAGPRFEVLAENALNDYCLSSPAISDGQIFIRTAHHLYGIGKRAGG